jgi:hypothetical protein
MKRSYTRPGQILLAALAVVIAAPSLSRAEIKPELLYRLSDFNGVVPYREERISVDRERDEVYVIHRNYVHVYNNVGMEVYRFGGDPALGQMMNLAVDEQGDIFLLSLDTSASPASPDRKGYLLHRLNYRGESVAKLEVSGLPRKYADFFPTDLFCREDRLLLVSRAQMLAVETDRKGVFLRGHDFAELSGVPEKKRRDVEIFGFSVDRAGNMYFTVPTLFSAFKVSPDGTTVKEFGNRGSKPGSFSVVTGIVADDHGNCLVADGQRNVVMVFDENFRFITEIGNSGGKKDLHMVSPRDIAIGNSGKLYVVQRAARGIFVFSVKPG